jgi:NAD(P)H-dependent flavin oxidoreductase YrpB (nitropropane dioxygenase family)
VSITSPPMLIQGGMGVAVSSWPLAAAVARTGQLGVVSGTALDLVLARRLQDGDVGGHCRRAMAHFPRQDVVERTLARYLRPDGRPPGRGYAPAPMLTLTRRQRFGELTVLANFVEVFLAKEGHDGPIGVNYLEKVQLATPFAVYGAMLAGVDYVLVGAGVPREIPQLLDRLARHERAFTSVDVAGSSEPHLLEVDPAEWLPADAAHLRRPVFLAIISSDTLAAYLTREDATRPDGFVVEGPAAGGHNAPPRGRLTLDDTGQPVYGPRDEANIERMVSVGLPFWLAGAYGTPERLAEALAAGAAGIQAGTIFALCAESGLTSELRAASLADLRADVIDVRTDPQASPTGFPFKLAHLTQPAMADQSRERLCDMGVLRTPFVRPSGSIGYRCAAEPVDVYVAKGGTEEQTRGVACLCNGLFANVGLGQVRSNGYVEPPLLTLGSDLEGARRLLEVRPAGWTAADAVGWLLGADVGEDVAARGRCPRRTG